MYKTDIRLSTIEDVRNFVTAATKYPGEMDLTSGRYTVDAKSIMGIFSLDLLNPITLTVHGENYETVLDEIKPFIVK